MQLHERTPEVRMDVVLVTWESYFRDFLQALWNGCCSQPEGTEPTKAYFWWSADLDEVFDFLPALMEWSVNLPLSSIHAVLPVKHTFLDDETTTTGATLSSSSSCPALTRPDISQ